MANKISINVVLSEIDRSVMDGRPVYFSLKYVKADGSLGWIKKGIKHKSDPSGNSNGYSNPEPKKAQNHYMKTSGNVRVFSEDKNGYREITIDQIVMFNSYKVYHG
jgi:hypothetical protein